ncbi:MAG: S46 family peptidase [Rhodothermales bacterium]
MKSSARFLFIVFAWALAGGCATTTSEMAVITERPKAPTENATPRNQPAATAPAAPADTIQAGRFDGGKMWTFDNPPLAYFKEAYGLELSDQWFEVASRSALRFGENCSASFVSRRGLVMTNHHCARESITKVSRPGEALLDRGFYAPSLQEERKVEGLYVDQLLMITDVTDKVTDGIPDYQNDEEEADARERAIDALEERMTRDVKGQDTTRLVQIVSLYNGGKYSAYTFKRYSDVRLVVAPELLMGKFGGDPDNFTYPRYSLDMSFFRVYAPDGTPIETEYFFPWSTAGVTEGDPVFVVGNPGSTSRLNTVSQLEYERDYDLPQQLEVLTTFAGVMKTYLDAQGDTEEDSELRNAYYSLSNSIKAMEGQLAGLRDPVLMAKKRAAERDFQRAVAADSKLNEEYGRLLDDLQAVQSSKKATARQAGALTYYGSSIGSRILTRALYGYAYTLLKQRGASAETLDDLQKDAGELKDYPDEVERGLIVARLHQIEKYLGRNDPTLRGILQGMTPEALADSLVASSALADSAGFMAMLDGTYLSSKDVSVPVINALAPLYFTLGQQIGSFGDRESNLNAQLSRARFEVAGFNSPPDATFSLRLADGVVKSYPYNGTRAPIITTFYGVYDHYVTYGPKSEWDLPERWKRRPPTFDLSTPLNLVSTNDITGGNSGSPLLNKNLEVVGLIFDGNIESLPNEYVFSDDTARAISVDARGIIEALDEMYDADRIVLELTAGQMAATEQEADAIRAQ